MFRCCNTSRNSETQKNRRFLSLSFGDVMWKPSRIRDSTFSLSNKKLRWVNKVVAFFLRLRILLAHFLRVPTCECPLSLLSWMSAHRCLQSRSFFAGNFNCNLTAWPKLLFRDSIGSVWYFALRFLQDVIAYIKVSDSNNPTCKASENLHVRNLKEL